MGLDYAIARIAAVYGRNWSFPDWAPKTRVTGFGTLPNWMLATLEKGDNIQEWTRYVNVLANPTLASDCADAMLTIFIRKKTGVFHCCGRTSVSRVELGKLVASTFGFDPDRVTALPDSAMDPSRLPGPLPERTALDVGRTENALGRTNLGVREGLKEWKKQRSEKVD
jgi:dTDP-4-dehydrorhamnose reductase